MGKITMGRIKSNTGVGKKVITEEPEFFRVIPAARLEGISCAHCRAGFDPSINWIEGYQSKVDASPLEKGRVYHLGCLRNYILIMANSEH